MKCDRISWDEYFMQLAELASTRSTCLASPVGAVIVRNNEVISTGYNSPPSGAEHCTDRGECYPGVPLCSASTQPSRAIHAEANAIALAAKNQHGTNKATIYVTLEPCLNCLKLLLGAGIEEVVYKNASEKRCPVKEEFYGARLIKRRQVR